MWKVVEKEKQIQVCLHWQSVSDRLELSKACILGVQDLSEMNSRLLRRRGAVGG